MDAVVYFVIVEEDHRGSLLLLYQSYTYSKVSILVLLTIRKR